VVGRPRRCDGLLRPIAKTAGDVALELPLGHTIEALGTPCVRTVASLEMSPLPLVQGGKPRGSFGSKLTRVEAFALKPSHVFLERGRELPVAGVVHYVFGSCGESGGGLRPWFSQ
jgi:hypothetical protein